MQRRIMTLALAGLLGSALVAGDAEACCHKKNQCATPCVAPAPCAAPAPVCRPKHGFGLFRMCHKKKACAPVCQPAYAPAAAPLVYAAPQGVPSAQWAPAPSGQVGP